MKRSRDDDHHRNQEEEVKEPPKQKIKPNNAPYRSQWDLKPTMIKEEAKGEKGKIDNKTINIKDEPINESQENKEPIEKTNKISLHDQLMAGIITPKEYVTLKNEQEYKWRNRAFTTEMLNELLPVGFEIATPPEGYEQKRQMELKQKQETGSLTNVGVNEKGDYYTIPEDAVNPEDFNVPLGDTEEGLPSIKPDDMKFFAPLLEEVNEEELTKEERNERHVMKLLLKIKCGEPIARRKSMRTITLRATQFGAKAIFTQVLPILLSTTLEEYERHNMLKVIDRVLIKLADQLKPFVHKILYVTAPLLINEDYFVRTEAKEIISNVAKAVGLVTMIRVMRLELETPEEYVRNITARIFAVVTSTLGIPAVEQFIQVVCKSKQSWEARHTGTKIVQQIARLMGLAVLPHLKSLVNMVADNLKDKEHRVRIMAAQTIADLANAVQPYGIEAFDPVLRSLWEGAHHHRGRGLAAFLKAIGFIIPLMSPEHAHHYTMNIMNTVVKQFSSNDDHVKRTVLKVVSQCVSTDGIEGHFVRSVILDDFLKFFWQPRMAHDRRNYREVVNTTIAIAEKAGVVPIVEPICEFMKHDNEVMRKMAIESISRILSKLGATALSERLQEQLVDGCRFAFDSAVDLHFAVLLKGFGQILKSFGKMAKPHLPETLGSIKYNLSNNRALSRQMAAELIGEIAPVLSECNEISALQHMGQILYEHLNEEYPEVLSSIVKGLYAITKVLGMSQMQPPIRDLLPRMAPIMMNRHEKVQLYSVKLIGLIADKGSEHVISQEWMRICFKLLELLKAFKKSIRQAAMRTFGYIARCIGPQEVISALLDHLKVQERQLRVCTTVAIAVVGETCGPFTVIPSLMTEYRIPEMNVQNGVLKALAYLFEYIADDCKDYIYAVVPLIQDAMMERDHVHRHLGSNIIQQLALGCYGQNREDALIHLLNFVWPNLFEIDIHVIQSVMNALDALRVALGPTILLLYTYQGLFHAAQKVRSRYWKVYNNIIQSSQDAAVPSYPRILSEHPERNDYNRYE
eukprot:CAMPEP_0117421862 /NCGR_PEP_ID=MMETSP0758-20121206/2829_1 /TAXON_ID=63605 /ORGANISM="Percolomonas cosmopolitus, Strain AE-1 (ATCC 50343)" /LENGTH=1026 /DNA_ID=CAMNT_0005204161 /DNA_START=11 /DNA_END=3088 /DNA_ORIENTATION=-